VPEVPPVQAARITTGGGKTERAAAKIARFIQEGKLRPGWSVLYLVPRHELGEHIDDIFRKLGLTAKVYRGRRADDPDIPGNMDLPKDERAKMCVELEKLRRAEMCGKSITESCCVYKKERCESYDECPYQQQFPDEQPQVWIAAHEMGFTMHRSASAGLPSLSSMNLFGSAASAVSKRTATRRAGLPLRIWHSTCRRSVTASS
jgi:hypothetical protein